jgi:hypothetical protein
MKASMYLEYATPPAHYTCTLTQRVRLTDTRKPTGTYKRSAMQTVRGTSGTKGYAGFYRDIVQTVRTTVYELKAGAGFNRGIGDTTGSGSVTGGIVRFFRTLFDHAGNGDSTGSFITRMRVIEDTESIGDVTGHRLDYLRGLFIEAGNMAETRHEGNYHRTVEDTAHNEGVSLRHLFVFIRLITLSLVRDYITGRFLKSKEELVIKSPVCREITLESTLH